MIALKYPWIHPSYEFYDFRILTKMVILLKENLNHKKGPFQDNPHLIFC